MTTNGTSSTPSKVGSISSRRLALQASMGFRAVVAAAMVVVTGRRSLEHLRLRLRCERLRAAGRRSLEHLRLRLRGGGGDGWNLFGFGCGVSPFGRPGGARWSTFAFGYGVSAFGRPGGAHDPMLPHANISQACASA